jgi:hypothetical protein
MPFPRLRGKSSCRHPLLGCPVHRVQAGRASGPADRVLRSPTPCSGCDAGLLNRNVVVFLTYASLRYESESCDSPANQAVPVWIGGSPQPP